MSLDCCAGVKDVGDPQGTVQVVGTADCYVAKGTSNSAIILFTDVFGFKVPNPRLIADQMSKETGHSVYVPDLFHGRELDDSMFDLSIRAKTMGWFEKTQFYLSGGTKMVYFMAVNSQKESMEIATGLIAHLRQKYNKIGVMGYCWGGKVVLTLGSDPALVDGIVANHPGALMLSPTFPSVFESVRVPARYMLAEHDNEIGPKQIEQIRTIAAKQQDVQVHYYPGTTHGFAVRGESDIPIVKQARDDVFAKTVEFFKQIL